jgi:TetR/AcrR family transcriptional regulator, transcriptional repressor for nem operon
VLRVLPTKMARNKEFIKEKALEEAMNTFWKKGYHDTSMQDLVDSMGINRASLYDTFGDKHRLYLQSLESYREINKCALLQVVENESVSSEKIRKGLIYYANESLNDTENKGCFMTNATLEMLPHDADVLDLVCDNLANMKNFLTDIIREGQAKGEIQNPSSPESLADFVQCSIGGLRILGKARPTTQQLFGIIDNVMLVLK